MAGIPMGAFAAFKVRDNVNGENSSGPGRNERGTNPPNNGFQQQRQPMSSQSGDTTHIPQYNGKLMNSIWGMYNRYSVHNIKSHIAHDQV